MNLNTVSRLLLSKQPIIPAINVIQTRGYKHKDVLQLRCDDCYFTKIDDRWHVLCTKFQRHKQIEKVERDKHRYIVSERVTNGYPAFKKRYQFPGQILS